MTIEATVPLIIRRPNGERQHLKPGVPVELPDQVAESVIRKAGGKVRVVASRHAVYPGQIVTWKSPALGELRGELLGVHADETMEVFHPLTERVARLPLSWLRLKE